MNQWDQDVYLKAWDFASQAHQGQVYSGQAEGEQFEYINHLGSVAMEVIWALQHSPERNGNFAIQCALLHDVIEDTSYQYDDLVTEFSEAVADGVLALSKNPDIAEKSVQMQDSLARIKQQPLEIWMVKLADRITNLSPPPWYWGEEKKMLYRDEARSILAHLGSASDCLSTRLQAKIDGYERYF